jgi:hypothetical protein
MSAPQSGPAAWLNRFTGGVRGGRPAAAAAAAAEASTSAPAASSSGAASPPAPPAAPSPGTQAKAEATKKYIENMYRERDKAAVQRLERRRSLERNDRAEARSVTHAPTHHPARAQQHAHTHAGTLALTHARTLAPGHSRTQRTQTEEERTRALAELERRETEYTRLRRQKLTVDDFEPLTIIGRGAFGEVRAAAAAACAAAAAPEEGVAREQALCVRTCACAPRVCADAARRAPRRRRCASCASAPRATCSR